MTSGDDITSLQCRAARAGLRWNLKTLSERAKVGRTTIARFEVGKTTPIPATRTSLRRAFEAAGVSFSGANSLTFTLEP